MNIIKSQSLFILKLELQICFKVDIIKLFGKSIFHSSIRPILFFSVLLFQIAFLFCKYDLYIILLKVCPGHILNKGIKQSTSYGIPQVN